MFSYAPSLPQGKDILCAFFLLHAESMLNAVLTYVALGVYRSE